MMVHQDIEHLPAFKNAVVTIGTFDGVHLGHQQIISQLKEEAARIGGETVIITFHPHPRKIVHTEKKKIELINTIDERIELLTGMQIDRLVIVPFTQDFSELAPRDYVEKFLIERFKPAIVIIGYDHRFGKDRQGDYKLLEEYNAKHLFELQEIPGHLINDSTVSSTLIREFLKDGNVEKANELLGYAFFFEGVVAHGDKRGRTIGFPTANIELNNDEKIVPGNGVYAVNVKVRNREYKGMMNIGVRPTVDGTRRTIEVNIFDFDEDIYGEAIRVSLKKFIRPEQKFSGLDALVAQLHKDKIAATRALHNE